MNEHDGWAFGAHLYVTRNGARTWRRASLRGYVVDLAGRGRELLALVAPCPPSTQSCSGILEASSDAGQAWRWIRRAPAGDDPLRDLQLLGGGIALLASGDRLLIGRDDLRTWTRYKLPCGVGSINGALGATASTDLWLACGGVAAMTEQEKWFYRSDGGRRWRLVYKTEYNRQSPAWNGLVETLVATSRETAYMATERGSPLETFDGGRSWRFATTSQGKTLMPQGAYPGAGAGWIAFPDTRDGFLGGTGTITYRTTDGGHRWLPTHP